MHFIDIITYLCFIVTMVQMNKTAGKVAATIVGAFMLAGCYDGRSFDAERINLGARLKFKQAPQRIVDTETCYSYTEAIIGAKKIKRLKTNWLEKGELPDGANSGCEWSVWWGL